MMNQPNLELSSLKEIALPEEAPASDAEEALPKMGINFTNVASDAE